MLFVSPVGLSLFGFYLAMDYLFCWQYNPKYFLDK